MLRHELHQSPPDEIHLLSIDYDNVLRPGDEHSPGMRRQAFSALDELTTALRHAPIVSGINTGRALPDLMTDLAGEYGHGMLAAAANGMSFYITSVGTALYRRHPHGILADPTWPVVERWNPIRVRQIMDERPELGLQTEPFTQSAHKVSYKVIDGQSREHDPYIGEITAALGSLSAQVTFSGGMFLDFLPEGINKGSALRHEARHFIPEFGSEPYIIAADDSMNGRHMLKIADLAIIPDNAEDDLKAWAEAEMARPETQTTYYLAHTPFAGGVLEGLRQFSLL